DHNCKGLPYECRNQSLLYIFYVLTKMATAIVVRSQGSSKLLITSLYKNFSDDINLSQDR
ncbi:MAG: hypothetical protein V7K89_24620, partial [Nostoc sp.]|uniref:hypothetical protein n=1 Tax=Nostoc sp. TaxID=1180 RepID=UPI002FF5ECBC